MLDKLNKAQREAASHEAGPLLIVAGAGTGKTTVLISRLLYLISEKGLKPDEILLTTFTEKAVGELTERADRLLPYGYTDLWIYTFHGFCERILREHALDIGLNPDFKLLNTTDQWVLIKKHLERFNLDYYRPLGNPTKFISELIRHFSRLKDEDITASQYLDYVQNSSAADSAEEILEKQRVQELAAAFEIYNQLLLENNALDFGDLIILALKLFRERPNILALYQEKFKYFMVDEFQDTNFAQYELIKLLAAKNNNLLVCGDDDQAIFRFRGASIFNIIQFKQDYPDAKEILLIENYRSNQEILDYAYNFIQNNNPNRLEAKLKLDKKIIARRADLKTKTDQAALSFNSFATEGEEAAFVCEQIKSLYQSSPDILWSDFAVLVRANASADKFVKELTRHGIPNEFVSLRGLYYKPVVLDCLAYLRLLDNYHESSALFRVLNMEAFKVSYPDIIALNKLAARKVWSLYEALKNASSASELSAESLQNINKLLVLIEKQSLLAASEKTSRLFLNFVNDSGLLKSLDRDRDLKIYSYLNQLYRKIKKLEENDLDLHLKDFLLLINMELEAGESGSLSNDFEDAEVVRIMTVHAAKGLEFKYVFLPNLVDKQFPTIARGEKIAIPEPLIKEKVDGHADIHLGEERRLFYVALTRAKDYLYLSAAKDYGGVHKKKPSKFLAEMGLVIEEGEASNDYQVDSEMTKDLKTLNDQPVANLKISAPLRYSFSQVAAYTSCPLQYKFAFILKIPAGTKNQFIFGQTIHHTLHQFLLPIVSHAQISLFDPKQKPQLKKEDLLNLYRHNFSPENWDSAENREKYRREGEKGLGLLFDNFLAADVPEVLFLEKSFTIKLAGEVIKGTIDRIDRLADGSVEIADYKTGKPKESLLYDDKRQLLLYQIVAEELLGLKVSSLAFYYLSNGTKLAFSAKPKDLEKLRLEIMDVIRSIKNNDFSPTPEAHKCGYCDFNNICEFRKV